MEKVALGVDLGGTHIYAGIINLFGKILIKEELEINLKDPPKKIIQEDLKNLIKKILRNYQTKILGIGIGLPGNLDQHHGICLFSPNFKWRNISIAPFFKRYFKLPCFIINDVNAMTMGEKYFGEGKNSANFICLTLGTGIGGGIVINNQLIYGECGGAGEIGHITVNPDGTKCSCGNIGCMEIEAAGPAIAKKAKDYLKKYHKSIIRKIKKITPLDVYQAAQKKDPLALKVWEETGKYLGIGLANCITILNPEKIIFGGRISKAFPFFIKSLKKEINFRARMIPKNFTKLLQAQLGEDAGIIGSACLVFEKLNLK